MLIYFPDAPNQQQMHKGDNVNNQPGYGPGRDFQGPPVPQSVPPLGYNGGHVPQQWEVPYEPAGDISSL